MMYSWTKTKNCHLKQSISMRVSLFKKIKKVKNNLMCVFFWLYFRIQINFDVIINTKIGLLNDWTLSSLVVFLLFMNYRLL